MRAQHTGGGIRPGHAGHPGPLYQPLAPDDPALVAGHRIAARLGVGALGPVYLAYAPDGRPVTLTAVRPELAARSGFAAAFEHDVQAVRRVHGPYTVPVLGSGHDGSRYWLAAGYVPALTLHAAVSGTGRPLPVPVVLRLVAGVAEALRAVHHAGVVHAGLGPGTVLLAADGPRVTGYGVTRAAADAPGIPAFSSPEQAADKPPVPATDVFALGQLAAYAAIGAAPFGARALHEEPDLSELPGELREIVTRCLIKDPALRPSPSQVIAMCTQATHHRPPTPWLPTPLQTLLTLPPPLPPLPPPGTWPQPVPAVGGAPLPPGTTPLRPAGPPGATPPGGTVLPPAPGDGVAFPTPAAGTVLPPSPPEARGAAGTTPPGATPPAGTVLPPALGGLPGVPGATPPGGVPVPSPVPHGANPPGGVPVPPGATPPAGRVLPPALGGLPGVPGATPPGGVPLTPTMPAGATPPGGTVLPPVGVPPLAGGGGPFSTSTSPVGATPRGGGPTASAAGGMPGGPGVTPSAGVVPPPAVGATPPGGVPLPPPVPPGATPPGGIVLPPVPPGATPPGGIVRMRGSGVWGWVVACVVVVVGAVAFGGGFDRGHRGSTAPPQAGGAPSARDYRGVGLAAGDGLVLETDPPQSRPGAENGTFGYSPDGTAFVAAGARGGLVLLGPQAPGTLEGCRAQGDLVPSVSRTELTTGSRLCVMGVDGTTALVTVRQLSHPGGPAAHATLDLTVWPPRQL